MPELLELAARCEAAERGDRELDALAAVHGLGWSPPVEKGVCGPGYSGRDAYEWHDADGEAKGFDVPRYTASLDAAMTLVPEGWDWCLSHACDGDEEGSFASLSPARKVTEACGNAATPALALCAAALRARAADHA